MGFYNPDAETEFRWAHVTGLSLRAGGQRLHHDTSPPSVIESAGLLEGEIFFARHYHLLDSCTTILSFFFFGLARLLEHFPPLDFPRCPSL